MLLVIAQHERDFSETGIDQLQLHQFLERAGEPEALELDEVIAIKVNRFLDLFGFGKRMFTDYNIEITKKWNNKWQSIFSYINQYYNKKYIEDAKGEVNTNIVAAEATYKFTATRSLRVMGEQMWADYDKKNWAGATAEFNLNSKLSFYLSDLYNYGNDLDYARNHYFNVGGAFRRNSTRIALNYGRQRGGLVCVGGVCRFVPESSGVSLSLNTSF